MTIHNSLYKLVNYISCELSPSHKSAIEQHIIHYDEVANGQLVIRGAFFGVHPCELFSFFEEFFPVIGVLIWKEGFHLLIEI